MQELDFAFIANPIEINQEYAKYIENLVTEKWRDDKALEALLENENFADTVGHDRVRLIIERIDVLRKEEEENEKLEEALRLAKEAHTIALQTQALLPKQEQQVEDKSSLEEEKKESL